MNGPSPRFSAAEVIQIASLLTIDDKAFVIGGQATNVWAWFFSDRHAALSQADPLTSKDIDYYGSRKAADALATAIGGTVVLPSKDHLNTPNTAVVIGQVNGKPIEIDFMHAVLGLTTRDLEKGVSIIRFQAAVDGVRKAIDVPVLHPVLCLRSRIANMLSPATLRRDELAFRQLEAACAVVSAYVSDALSAGDIKEAARCLSELIAYVRSDNYGRRARDVLGADVLAVVETFIHDERLDTRFRTLTLKQ